LQDAIRDYLKTVNHKDAEAQYFLGIQAEYGLNRFASLTNAITYYKKAADQGFVKAFCRLGQMCRDGRGTVLNHKKAVAWFSAATDRGDSDAQVALGDMYLRGQGVEQVDMETAVRYYSRAADQRCPLGLYNLGVCYERGWGVLENPIKAVELLEKAAKNGELLAQNQISYLFLNNSCVRNFDAAFDWALIAAERKNAQSCYRLGWMYENGYGVFEDHCKALEWYVKASRQYEEVIEGIDRIIKGLTQKAEAGSKNAQYSLGVIREKGLGVPKNPNIAFMWYERAADQGHAGAYCALGCAYEKGELGKTKDALRACVHYVESAKLGWSEAVDNIQGLFDVRQDFCQTEGKADNSQLREFLKCLPDLEYVLNILTGMANFYNPHESCARWVDLSLLADALKLLVERLSDPACFLPVSSVLYPKNSSQHDWAFWGQMNREDLEPLMQNAKALRDIIPEVTAQITATLKDMENLQTGDFLQLCNSYVNGVKEPRSLLLVFFNESIAQKAVGTDPRAYFIYILGGLLGKTVVENNMYSLLSLTQLAFYESVLEVLSTPERLEEIIRKTTGGRDQKILELLENT
jgi:TPR repeat protein